MQILKTIGVLALGGVLGVAATLAAQTAQSGTRREPQFENEHVRVWKSIIMPKQPLTMHRHEHPRALIALKGGTVDIVQKSGESQKVVWDIRQGLLAHRRQAGHDTRRHQQRQRADRSDDRRTAEALSPRPGRRPAPGRTAQSRRARTAQRAWAAGVVQNDTPPMAPHVTRPSPMRVSTPAASGVTTYSVSSRRRTASMSASSARQ